MLSVLLALSLSAKSVTAPWKRVNVTKGGDIKCDMCLSLVESVIQGLKIQQSVEEILKEVLLVCQMFPQPFSDVCASMANQYIQAVVDMIEKGMLGEAICTELGLCSATKTSTLRIPKTMPNDWACDMCQTVVKTVQESMRSTQVVEEVSVIVEQLCDMMPAPYSTLCHTLVKTYVGLIMELLDQGLEALDVCVRIGLCQQSPTVKKIRLPAGADEGMACAVCKQIVHTVEQAMTSTKVEAEVAALVAQACEVLSAPYSTICTTVVQQYVPVIMQYLEQGLEALDVCYRLGLCDSTYFMPRKVKVAKNEKKNGLGCDICHGVVSVTQEEVARAGSEEEVLENVLAWCRVFPIPFSTICENLANQYVPLIVKMIKDGKTSDEICVALGYCDPEAVADARMTKMAKPRLPVPLPAPLKRADNQTCEVCVDICGGVKDALEDTQSEEEIKALILLVCSLFPDPYQTVCTTITNEYITIIIELTEQGVAPHEICERLGLCEKSAKRFRLPSLRNLKH